MPLRVWQTNGRYRQPPELGLISGTCPDSVVCLTTHP